MKVVDSHSHLHLLDLEPYDGSLSALLAEAEHVGVSHVLCVAVELDDASTILDIARSFDHISASVGLHPTHVVEHEPTVSEIVALASDPKVVAIGETGLDYYRQAMEDADKATMQERFRRHIQAALIVNKPIIVHSRSAQEDTIRILQEERADQVKGVMHCFTESWDMAEQAMALNFYISFSGIVTFNNAKNVQDVARRVPLDRMLIETDAPYLTPVPFRGRYKNEPKYVLYVAQHIAGLRDMAVDDLAEQTTDNYFRLFKGACRE